MDITAFRTNFKEFADTVKYPDALITFYAGIATVMVNPQRWTTMATFGINLYVAHEITLAAQNVQSGSNGGPAGTQGGPMNTKTVGSVTVGYDTTVASEEGAGWWNLTSYGTQFYRLMMMMGSGSIQL